MKVYEVRCYYISEEWDGVYEHSDRFFTTYNGAVEYLTDECGLVKKKDNEYVLPEFVCSKGNINCFNCEFFCNSDKYNGTKFVEDGEETEWCPEHFNRWEREADMSYWTIVEHEIYK